MLGENWEKRFHAQMEWDAMFETRTWSGKIPYLKFPNDVEVKVIPPFSGAVVRFLVKKGEKSVSCYLDCYGILGAMDKPYWEIYPYEGDTYRCYIDETDDLMEKIVEELNRDTSVETDW
jgi:hypothetical protein